MADNYEVQDIVKEHEYDGIQEFDNPLPRWWLWTFALTVVFSVFYWFTRETVDAPGSFEQFAVEFEAHEAKLMAAAVEPEELIAMADDPAIVARGVSVYDNRCASCHGAKAEGGTGPNLTDRFWIHGGEARDIYVSIAAGYPKKGMPKWRGQIPEEDMQALTAYILSIRNTNVPGKGPQGNEVAL